MTTSETWVVKLEKFLSAGQENTIIHDVDYSGQSLKALIKSLLQEEREKALKEGHDRFVEEGREAIEIAMERGRREVIEGAVKTVEDYFEGLVVISNPQVTKGGVIEEILKLKK